MRRRRSSAMGSLDSLLDTMTNVVGILVILLVVTQLGVKDAVSRISKSEQVDPAKLEAATAEAAKQADARAELEQQLAALSKPESDVSSQDLAQLEAKVKQRREELTDVRRVLESRRAEQEAKTKELLAASRKTLGAIEQELKKLEQAFAMNADEIAKLKAMLANTPTTKAPAAKVVHLPNPRPAPKGVQPLTFLCRDGKIYFVNTLLHQNRAVLWTNKEILRRRLGNPAKGVDCGPLFASFNSKKFRDRDLQLQLVSFGRLPYLVFDRRESGGEATAKLSEPTSFFQRGMNQIDGKKYYLQFLVWNDSFETYLKARSLGEQKGLLAGWQPMTTKDEYKVRLASNLRNGPAPPPDPNAKPKPKPGDNPPSPPRPVPTDVID